MINLYTTKVILKEGEWYSLGSILAVRPKTVFEGCVVIISSIIGFVSIIVFCLALALFTE